MIKRAVLLHLLLTLSACYYAKDYLDVSSQKEYSILIGRTFSTKSRMLAQSFDQLTSTRKIASGKDVEIVDLLNYPGLENRHLKWTIEVPIGERFKIVRVIKTELAGGFSLYYQLKFENIEKLNKTITLVRVPNAKDIDGNAGLLANDFEEIKSEQH